MIRRYGWHDVSAMTALAVIYAVIAKIVLTQFSETGNASLVWFSGGLGLAVLLIKGIHYWPGIFTGAFAAGMMVDDAVWMSLCIAAGNTLESVVAAWWLRRDKQFSAALNQPMHFVRLSFVAACCSWLSALFGPWAIWAGGLLSTAAMPNAMLYWWIADVFGIAFTTPLLLVWRRWPKEWFRQVRWLEAVAFVSIALGLGLHVLLDAFGVWHTDIPSSYWIFLCMAWGALRFGRHGVTLVAAVAFVMGLLGAAQHRGLFANDFRQTGMMNFWLFMAVLSFTGMLLVLTLQNNLRYAQLLQGHRRRLQAIIDATPVPCALYNDKSQIILLNPAFSHCFGYTLEDIPTLEHWWVQAHPDPAYRHWVKETWQQRLRYAKDTGLPFQSFQKTLRCKNGEIRHVLTGAGFLQGTSDDEYVVTLMDLTEQARVNKALSDNNVLLQTVLETLPLRVFWKDKQGRYLGANRLFAQDAGFDNVEQVLGKDDYDLAWREVAAQYQADDRQVMEKGVARIAYEEPMPKPEGQVSWLRTSKMPLRNSEQDLIGVVGVYEDISMRKRIEDQLLDRMRFLEALLETLPDGVLIVSEEGRKLLQNRRVLELWGIPDSIAEQADDRAQVEFATNRTKEPQRFLEKVTYLYAHPQEVSLDDIELVDGKILRRFSGPVHDRLGHYYGRLWHFQDITAAGKGRH